MTTNIPVLPIAVAAPLRAVAEFAALAGRGIKSVARALRHCGEARKLVRLDSHMLVDIGITRADLRDAFFAPFWEDPTNFLAERAGKHRPHC